MAKYSRDSKESKVKQDEMSSTSTSVQADKQSGSNGKRKSRKSKGKDYSNPTTKYNDLTYYFKDPILFEQASKLSFQSFLGFGGINDYIVPSIMIIPMNPSPGLTYQGATPALDHPERTGINLASLKMFNILSMNSGRNMIYAPQDISMAILATGQVLSTISYLRRIIGVVKTSNPYNRMYPKAIVEALGVDYDDFVQNESDYISRLNNEIAAFNQIPVLMNCGYLRKCVNQFDFVFTDDDSPLAQTFAYVPYTTWVLDEQSYAGGSILKTIPFVGSGNSLTHHIRTFGWYIINVLRPQMDALMSSSTLNLVYADILKVSTGSQSNYFKTYNIPLIPTDYFVKPFKNYEALYHLHNMKAVGAMPKLPGFEMNIYTPDNDVYPDANKNNIIYNPGFDADTIMGGTYTAGDLVPFDVVIDSPVANPSTSLVAEMTRYVSGASNNFYLASDSKYYSVFNLLSDWYAICFWVFTSSNTPTLTFSNSNEISRKAAMDAAAVCDLTSQFDWKPLLTYWDKTDSTGKIKIVNGDLNFYTVVGKHWFERMNAAIYFGLFDI